MENLCEVGLFPFELLLCQERLDGTTSDQLIAEREEFDTHRDLSRFVKRTSMGDSAPADLKGGRLLSLRARY
jgi:hypothetical protein